MADPVELGPHDNMTVAEALAVSGRRNLKEVLILGTDQDGMFISVSSGMPNKDALWLINLEEDFILERVRGVPDDA